MGLTRKPLGSMGIGLLKTQLRGAQRARVENAGNEQEAESPSVERSVKVQCMAGDHQG